MLTAGVRQPARAVFNTEERERSSIFSAAADALQAYTSEHALDAAEDPNFDAEAFVRSDDTVYIHAPAEKPGAPPRRSSAGCWRRSAARPTRPTPPASSRRPGAVRAG